MIPKGRIQLAHVLRSASDVVRIDDVVTVLNLERAKASQLLSRWTKQGWLKRVGPGIYVPTSLKSVENERVVEDPWILVPALFGLAYVGGWSAAEHWDLTEQIFTDIVVKTTRHVRRKPIEVHGTTFILWGIRESQYFGTKNVWRGQTRIPVADIHRTIVDMFDEPMIGGGIQHVADCFQSYMGRRDQDIEKLISYAERLGNGAVFKRMGFLAERIEGGEELAQRCQIRLTKGNAKLDPMIDCARLVTRWKLRVPDTWLKAATA